MSYARGVHRRALLVSWLGIAACGGAEPPPAGIQSLEPDPQPYARSTGSLPVAIRTTAEPNSRAAWADPWPETSMTALARSIVGVARAAMEGSAWPTEMPFPLGRPDGQPRIESQGDGIVPPVRVLCFYAEVKCSFANAPPPGTTNHNIELGLLLCATGVRVVEIDEDPAQPGTALPPAAAGLGLAATDALAALALGRGQELMLRESDRDAMGGEPLFRRAMREVPRPEQLAAMQRLAAQRGPPTGFELDDMGIVVSDTRGTVGLQIDLEHMPTGFVIDGPPYVRIRRMP